MSLAVVNASGRAAEKTVAPVATQEVDSGTPPMRIREKMPPHLATMILRRCYSCALCGLGRRRGTDGSWKHYSSSLCDLGGQGTLIEIGIESLVSILC